MNLLIILVTAIIDATSMSRKIIAMKMTGPYIFHQFCTTMTENPDSSLFSLQPVTISGCSRWKVG